MAPRFSAFVYVADEEEGIADLDVIRLGGRWGLGLGGYHTALTSQAFSNVFDLC